MSGKSHLVVGIGELLWDLLPSGPQMGGAPTNFAFHCHALGERATIASRIGTDELGDALHKQLTSLGVDPSCLQRDTDHPTGTVPVSLSPDGQPEYTITPGVAWDYLEWTPAWESLAREADAVCYGTLGQRSPTARETIRRFLVATRPDCLRVFDVNLRQHYFDSDILYHSLERATVLKLNHDELPRVTAQLNMPVTTQLAMLHALRERFRLRLVCLTLGSNGCLLLDEHDSVESPGLSVQVADTVGAGDAFTAAMTQHLLHGRKLKTIATAANRLGSWVASQPGGTPTAPRELISSLSAHR